LTYNPPRADSDNPYLMWFNGLKKNRFGGDIIITYAALIPHPPLVIKEIGREQISAVSATIHGIKTACRQLANSRPDTIVFFTPHGNVFSDCVSYLAEPELEGDFRSFGCSLGTSSSNDLELIKEIANAAASEGITFLPIDKATAAGHRLNARLDHGILVPLMYLKEAGLKETRIIAISVGYLPITDLYRLGSIITASAEKLGRRIAVVASGDMSHRLKEEGPYDYHPDGPRFDKKMCEYLSAGDVLATIKMPAELRDNAGECGFRSVVMMLGTLDGKDFSSSVISYEGPFGVGYLVAEFVPGKPRESIYEILAKEKQETINELRQRESSPVKWARLTLENYIRNGSFVELPASFSDLTRKKAGVFVSIKKGGNLRGCIGTISPAYKNLAEEIAHNAVSAGLKDPRFMPLQSGNWMSWSIRLIY
jgi:aromatic ring-opening dioxygenase LigB subunit